MDDITLTALLIIGLFGSQAGLFGSQIYLFYFAFCFLFQIGDKIPAKNEVDKVNFPRLVIATAMYIVAALALIPFP